MNTIKLQQRGVLTLPKNIRDSLGLHEGEMLVVRTQDMKIVLERANTDTDLLRDITKSLGEIKQGKFIEFGSARELKQKINSKNEN